MNKGMKWYCIFIFLLIAIGTNAQKFEQKIETTGNRYNVIYNGKSFVVDTSTFVVKVDDEKYLKENYDVIRYNKLGYSVLPDLQSGRLEYEDLQSLALCQ